MKLFARIFPILYKFRWTIFVVRVLVFIVVALFVGFFLSRIPQSKSIFQFSTIIDTDEPSEFVGKVKLNDNISIRLLILKHCPDQIADVDGSQAIQAANLGKSKGLSIEEVGNYRVDQQGKTDRIVWAAKYNDLEGLKRFVSEQMKVEAKPGDTFMVYTIGHGGPDGGLMRLGQRGKVMKILAEAAEENEQQTFWWQLSCYAAAKLPAISSLNEKQQEFFAMTASSSANENSYFNTQGEQMKTVFTAMAEKSAEIDSNQDEIVTAGEFSAFMTAKFGEKRGGLVYARDKEKPIFGLACGLANQIPIVDRNGPQGKYPKNYIPTPQK